MLLRLAALGITVLLAGAGCVDDGSLLRYEGTPGEPQEFVLVGDTPLVAARVRAASGPARDVLLLFDTGAPVTVLSRHAFPDLPSGWPTVLLEANGLRFPELTVGVMPLFSANPCVPAPAGVIGADVTHAFRLDLDYRKARLVLDGPVMPTPSAELPLSLAGGGRLVLPGGNEARSIGATRLLVDVEVEGRPLTAMIDTGASLTVASKKLLASLGTAGRPRACCQTFNTQTGTMRAPIYRLGELRLGGLKRANLPVTVLPDSAVFAPISAEVGRPVDLLLGGSLLRYFQIQIDSGAGRLRLKDQTQLDHVDLDEWVLPGFTFCRDSAGGAIVLDVFDGTDAKIQGLAGGEQLVSVGGQDVKGLDDRALRQALRAPGVGQRVRLRLVPASGPAVERDIRVENVLPAKQ